MSITYNQESGVFTLHTQNSTYQMQVGAYGVLLHLYYGRRVEGTEMQYLIKGMDRGFSGNPYDAGKDRTFSLDALPQEYASFGNGDYRSPALCVFNPDGSCACDLRYSSHKITAGKPALCGLPSAHHAGAQALEINLEDAVSHVQVTLLYAVMEEEDVITRAALVRNNGEGTVRLTKALSCALDFGDDGYELITLYGRHAMERQVQRGALRHGRTVIDSARGASSHQQNPFAVLCRPGAGEEHGECYGLALVYSGNFALEAEVDQYHQTRVQLGVNPAAFCWSLAPGEVFTAPEAVLCFSAKGLGGLSRKLHPFVREHICRGKYSRARRPILINNWEATYFDFNDEKLLEIAKEAAKLGVEMLVVDDGWFGKRDDDCSGLGDWVVNERKLHGGLDTLCRQVNELGLKLGLWLEPEMVSEDSALYRAHPDWCLRIPGRAPNRSRYQLVLDMSRQDVQEYLYGCVSGILKSANLEYVKWDMNRSLCDVYSALLPAGRQGEVYHRYVLGLYALLERLTAGFPNVLFEGCSGGGGRFDLGMLYYTPQIWCSDNTDAIERIQIQYGTSLCYPISAVGAHVSACPNHQTGRITPLETRGVVAMAGTFGYELDLGKLTEEEKEIVKKQIADFRRYYDLITFGDYYRLTDPSQNQRYAAWLFVSPDKGRALLNVVQLRIQANPPLVYLRLQGLEEEALYTVGGLEGTYCGGALMHAGLCMPVKLGDYVSWQFEIQRA